MEMAMARKSLKHTIARHIISLLWLLSVIAATFITVVLREL